MLISFGINRWMLVGDWRCDITRLIELRDGNLTQRNGRVMAMLIEMSHGHITQTDGRPCDRGFDWTISTHLSGLMVVIAAPSLMGTLRYQRSKWIWLVDMTWKYGTLSIVTLRKLPETLQLLRIIWIWLVDIIYVDILWQCATLSIVTLQILQIIWIWLVDIIWVDILWHCGENQTLLESSRAAEHTLIGCAVGMLSDSIPVCCQSQTWALVMAERLLLLHSHVARDHRQILCLPWHLRRGNTRRPSG